MARVVRKHQAPAPLTITPQHPDFPDEVARYVCAFYESLSVRSARPQAHQWTVIAAFLICLKGQLKLISLGTGIKCVSNPVDRDTQVVDAHAEILARRELEAFLIDGARAMFQEADQLTDDELVLKETMIDLVVRGADLYLYTSHAPCGPASFDAQTDRLNQEDSIIRSILGIHCDTDANHNNPSKVRSERAQSILVSLFKKPSRGDAIPTTSYSCSDKLSRYQMLGLQGGRMSTVFEACGWAPLRMSGIIVGEEWGKGRGIARIFGGQIVTDSALYKADTPSRMVDGAEETFENRTDLVALRYYHAVQAKTNAFKSFHSGYKFRHSRSSAMAVVNGQRVRSINEIALSISDTERERLQQLPLALARETIFPPPAIAPFPISSSWRIAMNVEVLNPLGRLHGIGKNKTTGSFDARSYSRLCRHCMREAWKNMLDTIDHSIPIPDTEKGGQAWNLVNGWMEERGPWRMWHKKHDVERRAPAVPAVII
jgi:hypothetical protein